MLELSLSKIASITEGELHGADVGINSITTDSRAITQGQLFWVLKGARFDGHDFVAQTAANGAIAAVVEHKLDLDLPQIVVKDSLRALGALGHWLRQQVNPQVAAITGSNGKTSTKEMLAAILARGGDGMATLGNFNNDIGVPLTLLRLLPQHQWAVIELGANHRGEIAYTSRLAAPDVALINNVNPAHLEGFGSIAGVAQAKGEIWGGLKADGVAVCQFQSEWLDLWRNSIGERQLLTFSLENREADAYASDIQLNSSGCAAFMLHLRGQQQPVQLSLAGRHNVSNALAAALMASALGVSIGQIAAGLGETAMVKGRTNISELTPTLRVIDDTYNANVNSVKAAMDLLSSFAGRQIAVLGDMGELGDRARISHAEVGSYAVEKRLAAVACVGELSRTTAREAGEGRGHWFADKAQLISWLVAQCQQGELTTVLVKGSRSARMEEIVDALKQFAKEQQC